jgi:hypothetical protein
MPRRVYLLGVGLALVALALALTDWALSLQPGVTEANFRRIRVGMTIEEVETLLGGPGEIINQQLVCLDFHWYGDTGLAVVALDRRGDDQTWRVTESVWRPFYAPVPGPLARLRAWLGW